MTKEVGRESRVGVCLHVARRGYRVGCCCWCGACACGVSLLRNTADLHKQQGGANNYITDFQHVTKAASERVSGINGSLPESSKSSRPATIHSLDLLNGDI